MSLRAPALLAAVFAATAAAAPAHAAPPTLVSNSVARLVNDTRVLGPKDASATTRRRLLVRAVQIEGGSRNAPCRAIHTIPRYRSLLPGVHARGRTGRAASVRGTLQRDALAVDANLKQLPGTRHCGG